MDNSKLYRVSQELINTGTKPGALEFTWQEELDMLNRNVIGERCQIFAYGYPVDIWKVPLKNILAITQ